MRFVQTLAASLVLLTGAAPVAAAPTKGWTDQAREEMTQGCQDSIRANVVMDITMRYGVTEQDLPPEGLGEIEQIIRPVVDHCNCITSEVSEKFQYDDFIANPDKYQKELEKLLKGRCALSKP